MRALELIDSKLVLRTDYPLADVPDGWTRVRVLQAGICETDLQLLAGYMGFAGVLGHEFVGVAEDGPLAGERVTAEINCACHECDLCNGGLSNHCPQRSVVGILNHDGAFADSLVVPNRNLHRVPDAMSDDLATLVEPVAAALQIREQVDLRPGMMAAVVGDGRLGNLCAQVLKLAGCHVVVVGKHQEKLATFQRLGLETRRLDELTEAACFDVVVECAGSPTGLDTALALVRPRGTVFMKTTIAGNHELSLAPVVINEINLLGSRCGPFDKAIACIAAGELDLDGFITARYPLEEFAAAFARARQKDALKVMLQVASDPNATNQVD